VDTFFLFAQLNAHQESHKLLSSGFKKLAGHLLDMRLFPFSVAILLMG